MNPAYLALAAVSIVSVVPFGSDRGGRNEPSLHPSGLTPRVRGNFVKELAEWSRQCHLEGHTDTDTMEQMLLFVQQVCGESDQAFRPVVDLSEGIAYFLQVSEENERMEVQDGWDLVRRAIELFR